jgi:hypothetical protein
MESLSSSKFNPLHPKKWLARCDSHSSQEDIDITTAKEPMESMYKQLTTNINNTALVY